MKTLQYQDLQANDLATILVSLPLFVKETGYDSAIWVCENHSTDDIELLFKEIFDTKFVNQVFASLQEAMENEYSDMVMDQPAEICAADMINCDPHIEEYLGTFEIDELSTLIKFWRIKQIEQNNQIEQS